MKNKQKTLTEQDFRDALSNDKISKFASMLTNKLYSFRVKEALFLSERITTTEFLYNENIYDLPMAVMNKVKEISIDKCLLDVFDCYLLSEELVNKGDALTAFLLDHNKELYYILKSNISNEKKISEQEYIQVFNEIYNKTSDILLDNSISECISGSVGLQERLAMEENLN